MSEAIAAATFAAPPGNLGPIPPEVALSNSRLAPPSTSSRYPFMPALRLLPMARWLCLFCPAVLLFPSFACGQTSAEFAKIDAFLKQHCVSCHGESEPKAGLKLHVFKDEGSVIRGRKVWDGVVQMIEAGEMPPQGKPRPDVTAFDSFLQAVNTVFERADRDRKPDPGQVTIRRLNRVEYANTVRDLVGIDFNPAEDFPADDIGYGFDNIGDVLTMSPVLMERYLAAADNIMQRAIVPKPGKPTSRHVSAQYTEPAGGNVPMQKNYRVLSTEKPDSGIQTGPIFTSYKFEADGEYIFRCRVYGEREGDLPVKIAILACGNDLTTVATDEEVDRIFGVAARGLKPFVILNTVDVTAKDAKTAQVIETRISPTFGLNRMAVALLKPDDGTPPPKLFVEHFALEGPLDPRPASHRRLLNVADDVTAEQRTRDVLTRFVTKAFRRPATQDEVARYSTLVTAEIAAGQSFDAAMQFAMQAVLVSPKFLFRVELDQRPDSNDAHPIDEFQLASRLSYFLWSTMPDDELHQLAAKNELTANLDAQVRRMLQDPKSVSLVNNFAMQWLQLQRLQIVSPDPKAFPSFNDRLRRSMLKETELFFEAVIREDRSILDLLASDFTFLNESLARHYGVQDTVGNKSQQKENKPGGQPIRGERFVRVSLQDQERGGLLTQASVLSVTSNPTRTSPVKRGKWVLEQILGTPPPPPPPDVPELPQDDKSVLTGSLRQRLEQHRANPSCANCHAKMDPLGFAFENFDAIGAFRSKDGEFPIDPSGTLPDGRTVAGPGELKLILKDKKDQFSRCLTEKLMIYALGRGLDYYDKPALKRVTTAVAANDFKFSTLVAEIAKSEPFRLRRGKQQ